ncbi:MAG TPA: FHA domain-containing protein, partial [Thermoanaerobaculia bacterium]|nr:FHA domain-containing protein [Thermoanaerobaculia bacterium]
MTSAPLRSSMLRLRYVLEGEDNVYPLTGAKVRLGRGSDNDIVLSDVSVSRYHAELRREDGTWYVQDLKSTNGVEVNRVGVERAVLQPRDRLGIGVFDLLLESFEPRDVRNPQDTAVAIKQEEEDDTGPILTNATIIRPLAEFAAAYGLAAKPAEAQEATREQTDADRRFGYLTRLARFLINAETVDEVLLRVLDISFGALPVDRGFILLSSGGDGELECELMRIKDRVEVRPSGEIPVSRTMLRAVMKERVALVTFDAQSDQRL